MTENAEAEGREPRPIRKTGIPIRWCFGAVLLVLLVFFGFSRVDTPEDYESKRDEMVRHQIVARGIKDEAVIAAMSKVPRHLFVPEAYRSKAYSDGPLPIGEGQTISQPYIVALMTELLELDGDEKVLEIGTGSGYQAAVLAEITKDVYSIEIMPALYKKAGETLSGGFDFRPPAARPVSAGGKARGTLDSVKK